MSFLEGADENGNVERGQGYEVGRHLELFYSIFLETLQECSHGIFLQLRRLEHFPVPTFSLEQGVNYVQHAVNSFDMIV